MKEASTTAFILYDQQTQWAPFSFVITTNNTSDINKDLRPVPQKSALTKCGRISSQQAEIMENGYKQ